MLLKLTGKDDVVILVNFNNVILVERGEEEDEGCSIVVTLGDINVTVKEDLDEILTKYTTAWNNV